MFKSPLWRGFYINPLLWSYHDVLWRLELHDTGRGLGARWNMTPLVAGSWEACTIPKLKSTVRWPCPCAGRAAGKHGDMDLVISMRPWLHAARPDAARVRRSRCPAPSESDAEQRAA